MAAAAEFERELARYEKISAELGRTSVRSHETLNRTQQLLSEAAACEEALGARLQGLLAAMNLSRDKQQACMAQTLAAARTLQERANEFTALLERVSALGQRARETSEPAIQALSETVRGDAREGLVGSLEALGEQMVGIIHEADAIATEADRGDWPDISRDVRSLKQQVEAAYGRVRQACTSVSERLLS